jgi:hypothetical protein
MKHIMWGVCIAVAVFAVGGCQSQKANGKHGAQVIGTDDLRYPRYGDTIEHEDYENPDNWLARGGDGQKEADVFFLYPTSWRAAYGEYPIASIGNPDMRHWAAYYLKTRASAFETAGNIYAPFYRQLDASFVVAQKPSDGI